MGVKRKDKIINKYIRSTVKVEPLGMKMKEGRLRWYELEMSTAQRTRRRAAARAPRNFLIKFTAPCGHRAIVYLKFTCGYLLLCLKFAVQCGHSAGTVRYLKKFCSAVRLRAETLQCSAGTVQEKCARDNSSMNMSCGETKSMLKER